MLCEQCRVYEATMLIDDEWMCEVCTSGAIDPDDDYPEFSDDDDPDPTAHEFDPACRCVQCTEAAAETAMRFEMGELP